MRAEVGFDGRLLDPEGGRGGAELGPVWWQRLVGRKCCVPAEGGTARGLLESGSARELCLRVRPCVDGRRGRPTLSGTRDDAPFFARSIVWNLVRMATTPGGDCLLHYRRADG